MAKNKVSDVVTSDVVADVAVKTAEEIQQEILDDFSAVVDAAQIYGTKADRMVCLLLAIEDGQVKRGMNNTQIRDALRSRMRCDDNHVSALKKGYADVCKVRPTLPRVFGAAGGGFDFSLSPATLAAKLSKANKLAEHPTHETETETRIRETATA